MKNFLLICLSIILISFLSNAQTLQQRFSEYGEIVITHLHNASFPDTGRANGHTYNKKFYSAKEHYNDSTVAVFIPKGYKQTGAIDFVIHFHGWNNNVASTLTKFNLVKQFVESGKNAMLVIPEGPKNSPDSYGGKLESKNGFSKFIHELVDTLYNRHKTNTHKVGKIILTGHSGGYHVISFILMRGGFTNHIKEVYLFDALYAEKEKFIHWFDKYDGKLIDIFTEHGGTKEESLKLMADLKGWEIPFIYKNEDKITSYDLANNRLIFIYTDLPHNQVVYARNEFRNFIKASCLKNIK